MIWDDQAISDLRRLWTDGHSTAEIGRRLRCSKNAIVGKAHRIGLEERPSPIRRKPGQYISPPPSIPRSVQTLPPLASYVASPMPIVVVQPRVVMAPPTPAPQPPLPARVMAPPPPPTPVPEPMPRLSSGRCEWLDGDRPKTFVRCAKRAVLGMSWCACHSEIVFMPRRPRRLEAA